MCLWRHGTRIGFDWFLILFSLLNAAGETVKIE